MYSEQSFNNNIERIFLYEKYKLVERTEPEVNGVWKGAHLLLFFLAFVFGSFCTFCFHILMYLFDEKCILFPKLVSLSSLRQNIIYEFIPEEKDMTNMSPVEFLSTQWVEKSTCLLPTYVPLVSGIFGLVWTTMFLMCSVGSRVLTGLQRPWRVLPPVFLFSTVMGGVCVYTSAFTHYGLQELCTKLNEITGGTSCTYTVNVATLAYQRRIRGLYQATRLTIATAWLHTACWLLSALLALLRVLLAVDFKLVRVRAELRGNIDRMLERHEREISTISPSWAECRLNIRQRSNHSIKIHFIKKCFQPNLLNRTDGDVLYRTDLQEQMSELALVLNERLKLERLAAINAVPEEHQFIVKILYSLLNTVFTSQSLKNSPDSSPESVSNATPPIIRQYGQQQMFSLSLQEQNDMTADETGQAKEMTIDVNRELQAILNKDLDDIKVIYDDISKNIPCKSCMSDPSEIQKADKSTMTEVQPESITDSKPDSSIGKEKALKSSLKHTGVQTAEKAKDIKFNKVQIESRTDVTDSNTSQNKDNHVSKSTQTDKEKQD